MSEKEAIVGRQTHNLLVYGTVDPPQIVIPEKPVPEKLVYAGNLASVPSLFDALPRSDGRPYAIFDTRVAEPTFPKTQEVTQPVAPKKPSVSLILVRFSDSTDVLQNQRQIERGTERSIQYGRLVELIDKSERELRQGRTHSHFFCL